MSNVNHKGTHKTTTLNKGSHFRTISDFRIKVIRIPTGNHIRHMLRTKLTERIIAEKKSMVQMVN